MAKGVKIALGIGRVTQFVGCLGHNKVLFGDAERLRCLISVGYIAAPMGACERSVVGVALKLRHNVKLSRHIHVVYRGIYKLEVDMCAVVVSIGKEVVNHFARWHVGRFVVVAYFAWLFGLVPMSCRRKVGTIERSYRRHFVFFGHIGLPNLFGTLIVEPHLRKSVFRGRYFPLAVKLCRVGSDKRIGVFVYQLLRLLVSFVHVAHV